MTKKDIRADNAEDLRKQAEKIARKKAFPEKIDKMSPAEVKHALHELRVHQIELEMQNEELLRAQVELDASGERFFDFYDLAPVGYVTVSEKGLIFEANLTCATMLGLVRSELLKKPLSRFILPTDQDIHYQQQKNIFETYEPQAYELRMLKKDRSTFWARLQAITAQDAKGETVCRIVLSDVTERKQKDEALRKAHWRLEGIIEGTHLGTWEWNVQTGETVFDDVWAKVTGYALAELAPISIKTWETLCHPDDLKQSAELLERHFAGELPYYDVECRMKHKDGYWVWVHDRGRIMSRTAEGKPLIMFGTHSNITLRKRFEEVQIFLAQTSSGTLGEPFFKALARYLAQNLGMDYVCIDRLEGDELTARTVAVWCDGHFEDNVTYALKDTPCGDVVGKTVCFFPSSVCQLFPRDPALQELRAESYIGVTLFDHTGRSIGLIALIGRSVLSLEKRQMIEATLKIVAVRAAAEMERLDAVDALLESEVQYRQLFDTASDALFLIATDTEMVVEANSMASQLYGYDRAEFLTKKSKDLSAEPEETSRRTREMQTIHDQVVRIPLRLHRKKDGTIFPVEITARYLSIKGRSMLLVAARDITARMQAEQALQESEFRLARAEITAKMGNWKLMLNTKEFIGSAGAKTIYGVEGDIISFADVRKCPLPEYIDILNKALNDLITKDIPYNLEIKICRPTDGKIIDIHSIAEYDKENNIVYGVIQDVTEQKQMEVELLRAQKLESLGVLAGGIAHDFNNLMTVVMGYIELVIMDLPPGHVSRQRLQAAIRGVDQTRELTSRLITFSRGGGPLKEMADVTKILRDAVRKTVKDTEVKAKFDFREDIWQAEVDDLQIIQCFYNLTRNAVEAMPQGGNLTVQAENALMQAGEVPEMEEGSYLKITFADEGGGIPEELQAKIFDPYFTTKKMGAQHGLGLGLAVCYSVIKQHGGHITAQSSAGKGAAFILYLPVRAEMTIKKEVKAPAATGTVRVLIMDDEPQIREIERIYLERWGYEVTEAKDGQEAIDAYKEAFDAGSPFDLVMLDLTVHQGMGGQMAMTHLLKINPAIKAIVASGYVTDPVMEDYSNYGFRGAMKKPFQREEMKFLVEKILNPKGENGNENINR